MQSLSLPIVPPPPPPAIGLLGPNSRQRLIAVFAALCGVLLTGFTCSLLPTPVPALPLLMGAVGSVSVLLFVVPASPFAQPWAIIGGNVVSALVGVLAAQLIPSPTIAAAVAVSGAILAMSLCRCLHPPGGASALAGVMGGPAIAAAGWIYPGILFVNCSVLVLTGLLIHALLGNRYPQSATPMPAASSPVLDTAELDRLARAAVAAAVAPMADQPRKPENHPIRSSDPTQKHVNLVEDRQMRSQTKWHEKIGFSAMIAIMVAVLLVSLSAATYVSTGSLLAAKTAKRGEEMQETNIRVAWHVLHGISKNFRVEGDQLYVGNVLLNGNSATVDQIKTLVGGSATIFRGDMRVATNVTTDTGARAVGTALKPGKAYDAVLGQGVPYRGSAEILGKPYFTAYDPIKDSGGRVVGILFVGIPASDMFAENNAIKHQMLVIAAIMATLGAIASVFAVKLICRPLVGLRDSMAKIADDRFDVDIPGLARNDEIGAMAKAVKVFRENGIAKKASDEAKARADADQKMVVDTVSSHLAELSEGDLTAAIKADFPTKYASLKTNFNEALGKLRELIGAVRESAENIRTGSHEIAQASEDLARRTEGNAASLEETAASVTQMDGRLRASAQAASRTVNRADQAIATVGGGRAVADEAVQAMGRVSDSAKGIDSVIEGLDKIAFQTRVLAMNAAVEAGRAGEAGRGFAVVADLVSALAMRAEEEAKRARNQLTVTQTEIVTAVEAVQKVDGALANISGDVGQVHDLLSTMAADNQAQSQAVTEISSAIGTMDRATQQNAAMVEETSAAARNLTTEIAKLSEQARRFSVSNGGTAIKQPTKSASARQIAPWSSASGVKPLPAVGKTLVNADDDWNSF